jgi:lipopolysaccharide biosynthesis glycosyltransferase|tara:strand:- start:149 stop:958 length:810 start_codon:yes stop_codon:yes gene_type:complete
MKTAIYQYWYGSKPKESANAGKKNMKAYANKIGADYIFETDPKFYGGPCSLEKKYSALRPIYDDMFLKYDKIMYVDLDVFVTDKCTENIFDEDIKHIGICEEPDQPKLRTQNVSANTYINNLNDNVWAKAVKDKYGCDVNRDSIGRPLVYNSGMIVITNDGLIEARKKFIPFQNHIDHLMSAGLRQFYLSDQTYYQTMMYVSGVDFKILDCKWNSQIHYLRKNGNKTVNDCRKENTNFVHVQIAGADDKDENAHWRMVNLPVSLWNINV